MILKLTTYLETRIPLDHEFVKDIFETILTSHLKGQSKYFSDIVREAFSERAKEVGIDGTKFLTTPNLEVQFLEKAEVLEKMRTKK